MTEAPEFQDDAGTRRRFCRHRRRNRARRIPPATGRSRAEQEDVPVKTADFEILDKGDNFIGEDDPRSKFYAETLARADWDPGSDTLLAAIDKLVLVHRLREVVSLLGFTRFEAISPDKDGELDLDVIRASLAETITWLPAVENRGEGVFLSFRTEQVERWLARPGALSS